MENFERTGLNRGQGEETGKAGSPGDELHQSYIWMKGWGEELILCVKHGLISFYLDVVWKWNSPIKQNQREMLNKMIRL